MKAPIYHHVLVVHSRFLAHKQKSVGRDCQHGDLNLIGMIKCPRVTLNPIGLAIAHLFRWYLLKSIGCPWIKVYFLLLCTGEGSVSPLVYCCETFLVWGILPRPIQYNLPILSTWNTDEFLSFAEAGTDSSFFMATKKRDPSNSSTAGFAANCPGSI